MSRGSAAVDVAALAERVAALEVRHRSDESVNNEVMARHGKNHHVLQDCHNRVVGRVESLEATVARQGEALRVLQGWLIDRELRDYDPTSYVSWVGAANNAFIAALDAPATDPAPLIDGYTAAEWASVGVDATDPAPDAVVCDCDGARFTHHARACPVSPYEPLDPPAAPPPGGLPGPVADAVDYLRAHAARASEAGIPRRAADYHDAADALAAWARALPPAMGDETRADILKAAEVLMENAGDYNRRGYTGAGIECESAAARLRAAAGDAHA